MNEPTNHIRIDLDAIIARRVPGIYRHTPRAVIALLERIICQDELNRQLDINQGKTGAAFCRGVLDDLKVGYNIVGKENLPPRDDRRKIFVCNHPLGGLDGIVMIDMIDRLYGSPLHFIVNDLLAAIGPLKDVFLPVNKHGRQSRGAAIDIDEAFDGPDPIIMFPAGLCSRRRHGKIADLKWNKMFVNRAIHHRRDIVPVYFDGHNSSFFYNFARLRERLGLKFNYEMIALPGEVFKSRGKTFTIKIGEPISHPTLAGGRHAAATAAEIRSRVYTL